MADPKSDESNDWSRPKRGWLEKFRNAFQGIVWGVNGQPSFIVHGVAVLAVVTASVFLKLNLERWCLLILCMGVVLAAEMFNSAIESICRSITNKFDKHVQRGLDIASGAVLVMAITAAIVGVLVLVEAYWQMGSGAS